MKILVVEDHLPLRECLAHMLKNLAPAGREIEVLEAGTLDEARELLPQAHAVLCDGSFPTHRGDRPEFITVTYSNWAPVLMECQKLKVPFVMLSAHVSLVERLNRAGTLAFAKPGQLVDALRSVVLLAESMVEAAERQLAIEDPRIQAADIENSRISDEGEPEDDPKPWWKKLRD